jgi:hypothetical protein
MSRLLETSMMIELEEMHSKELLVQVTYYYEPEEYDRADKMFSSVVEIVDIRLLGNSVWELVDNYEYNVIEETILNLHQGE